MQVNYWATPTWNTYYKQICLLLIYTPLLVRQHKQMFLVDNSAWWASFHSSSHYLHFPCFILILFYKWNSYVPVFTGIILLEAKITIHDYSTKIDQKRLFNIIFWNYLIATFTFFPESKSILIAWLEALRKGHTDFAPNS